MPESAGGFVEKYMFGRCGDLAIALSVLTGKPIAILFPENHSPDTPAGHFRHAFVLAEPDCGLDARGIRPVGAIRADFSAHDDRMEIFDDAAALVGALGVDPSGASLALSDWCEQQGWRELPEAALMTLEMLSEQVMHSAPPLAQRFPAEPELALVW